MLDYRSNPKERGKNLGDDLAEGKPTLPLIHALKNGSGEQRAAIREAIKRGGIAQLEPVIAAIIPTADWSTPRSSRASSPNWRSPPSARCRTRLTAAAWPRWRASPSSTRPKDLGGPQIRSTPVAGTCAGGIAPRRTLPLDCATPTQRTYS